MNFRLRLKIGEICDERGISIAELARKADISPNTAKSLYYGIVSRIDIPVIEKVASGLGMRPTALLRDVEEEQPGNVAPLLRAA